MRWLESIGSVGTGFFSEDHAEGARWRNPGAANRPEFFTGTYPGSIHPAKTLLFFVMEPKKRLLIGKFRAQQNHDGTKVALFLISPYLAPKFYWLRRNFASKIVFY
jgi:hypothetical protein